MYLIVAATIATAVGTGVSVYGQVQAGKAQEDALKEQARQEQIAAEGRELERQQQLSKALAANTVGLAAGNVGMEGTPASIALESAKNIGMSEGMLKMSDRLAQAQLKRQGKNAKSAAYLQAGSTLLSGGAETAKLANSIE
jgi:uncharacterized protein HemX|tara:strand:- start:278 stop:700 length:423 start_codon:yes stop_codon:yes gene_type:complete